MYCIARENNFCTENIYQLYIICTIYTSPFFQNDNKAAVIWQSWMTYVSWQSYRQLVWRLQIWQHRYFMRKKPQVLFSAFQDLVPFRRQGLLSILFVNNNISVIYWLIYEISVDRFIALFTKRSRFELNRRKLSFYMQPRPVILYQSVLCILCVMRMWKVTNWLQKKRHEFDTIEK